jgi:glycosyltransferase involved in cell wall biosynthesis
MSNSTQRYNRLEQPEPNIRRPHPVHPSISSARVILTVRNFSNIPGVCHIGLGVTALNTIKVLRRNGVHAEAWAVQTYAQLKKRLEDHARRVMTCGEKPITHVIVSAPSWVLPPQFGEICFLFSDIEFVQLNHSGCAYLSIDKCGIKHIRECIDLELQTHNMRVAGNNDRFTKWIHDSFGSPGLLLPNLYDTDAFIEPPPPRPIGDTIRIGSFGASRPWKNQLTAAEAAVQLARRLGMNLELYVNTKRPDGGERMIESRLELFDNLAGCKLIEVPWEKWPRFRATISRMHLLFQPSFDETFNVVTADGIAEGIPTISTSAIEWTPKDWWCTPEDPSSLMHVGLRLLRDPAPVTEARYLLKRYVIAGVGRWLDYILRRDQV